MPNIHPEVIKFQNELATPLYAYVYSAEPAVKQTRVYIAGKVTGLAHDEVVEKFAAAEKVLTDAGFDVVNPVSATTHLPEGTDWQKYMRITMCLMLTCDVVVLLPDYLTSKGALAELRTAEALGMQIDFYPEFNMVPDYKHFNTPAHDTSN